MEPDDKRYDEETEEESGTPWGWIAASTVTIGVSLYGAYKLGQRSEAVRPAPTPSGPARTPEEFLQRARAVVTSGNAHPQVRRLAADLRAGTSETPIDRLAAIHGFVRDEVTYHADPGGRHDYLAPAHETLQSRVGDCDDQAIFLASLLEADGFETALMWVPKHVVACVEVSQATAEALWQRFGEHAVVLTACEDPGRRWIPLEVTGPGFTPGELGGHTDRHFQKGEVVLERRPRFGSGVERNAA